MITYDLHVHTTASDGLFTPSQVVEKAVRVGLKGIAITDHDEVGGIQEAVNYAKVYAPHFKVIPGIELNTNQEKESIHVLGYFMDFQSEILLYALQRMREWREERAQKIVEKLWGLGYRVEYSQVRALAKGAVGRPHIARVLVKNGLVNSEKWAFDHLLTRGKPAYVPRHPFTPLDAVRLIHQGGGVAVLAHPGLVKNQKLVTELLDDETHGFDGLEVHYPAHKLYQVQKYETWAKERNLLITGGSDFHGEGTQEHASQLGFRGLDDEKQAAFVKKGNVLRIN